MITNFSNNINYTMCYQKRSVVLMFGNATCMVAYEMQWNMQYTNCCSALINN